MPAAGKLQGKPICLGRGAPIANDDGEMVADPDEGCRYDEASQTTSCNCKPPYFGSDCASELPGLVHCEWDADEGTCGRHALRWLQTTNPPREANYTYSRNFGAPFEGLGMGLPLAALHARYLHGELHLSRLPSTALRPSSGVHASFTFDVTGDRAEPEWALGR